MNWITKMRNGMELIHSACEENNDCRCEECPFITYCDVIYRRVSQRIPDEEEWIKEGAMKENENV